MGDENGPDLEGENQPTIQLPIYLIPQIRLSMPNTDQIIKALQEGKIPDLPPLHTSIDMTIIWLPIAINHFQAAHLARLKLKQVIESRIDDLIYAALLEEFNASLQVFAAAGFAFEAFERMVRQRSDFEAKFPDKINTWEKNKTGWDSQAKEVFNCVFAIEHQYKPFVWKMLTNVADFRNDAVHTRTKAEPVSYHNSMGYFTAWRLVKYGFDNAVKCIVESLNTFAYLPTKARQKYPKLVEYCEDFTKAMEPIINQWKEWDAGKDGKREAY